MKNIYNKISYFILLLVKKVKKAIASFSKKESIIFLILLGILIVGTIGLLAKLNNSFMVKVPRPGGSISEGIVGSPRFINPVLAYSSVDNDLVSLVYSGLTRKDNFGNIIPDLAEKYEVSEDGLNYTFTLKEKIFFQDGEPITVDDIIFTINKIKDPIIKSPQKIKWDGIEVSKIDEKNIIFHLKKPYASFLENTTVGILPKHIWENSTIEINDFNIKPIGSGPYKIKNVKKINGGNIEYIQLVPFKKFTLGKPYIHKITFIFYNNENEMISGLLNGEVEQISSITPKNAENLKNKKYLTDSFTLPRVFGLFLNPNKNQIFTDKDIVKAIDLAIDKERIINEIMFGYGIVIDSPIPPGIIDYQKITDDKKSSWKENLAQAEKLLAKNGWQKGISGILEKTTTAGKKKSTISLSFSISTNNNPDLTQVAEIIKENLTEIGINVEIKKFEAGNLNQLVIRPRNYEVLLFGQIINSQSDLSAFWHSSQRNDPGQNIAMYTNAKVDKILEEAPSVVDNVLREKKYIQFEEEVKKDMGAIFLYSPDFIYLISKNLKGLSLDNITYPSDRFSNVYHWYLKTDNVWKIFK